jgi:hypothetical protein
MFDYDASSDRKLDSILCVYIALNFASWLKKLTLTGMVFDGGKERVA